jgi:nitric oxide reductase NorD protein
VDEREEGYMFETEQERSLSKDWRERLRAIANPNERQRFVELLRRLRSLPADRARVAVEVSAALAMISLRASAEFLRAAPEAAQHLEAEELRAWGEMGRRLAMSNHEAGQSFFAQGVAHLVELRSDARKLTFQICLRQMALSSSIALSTYRRTAALRQLVESDEELCGILEVALEIARRSAKHSADFLDRAAKVAGRVDQFGESRHEIMREAIALAASLAARAGGIAADFWALLPTGLDRLSFEEAHRLFRHTERMLEYGGAVALRAFAAGSELLRLAPETFADWTSLLRIVGEHSSSSAIALARVGPEIARTILREQAAGPETLRRIIAAARQVAQTDTEAAIACFRSATSALRSSTLEQFEAWAAEGLRREVDAKARRSYYALETRQSNEALRSGAGLTLEQVAATLRLYVEALTGREVEIAPLVHASNEARINDGRTIHLPPNVAEFETEALNFRLYKVLAAHAAGQIEFGTHARGTPELRAAYESIAELYAPENVDALDAFSLNGYINDPTKGEAALPPEEEARMLRERRRALPEDGDYRTVLALFPQKALATRIFSTLENGRIDRLLRRKYRGLARDLDLVREHLRATRPRIADLPINIIPFELLFQITLCGGARDDARQFYGQIVSELESIVADYLTGPTVTVADTLMATSRVYALFRSVAPEDSSQQSETNDGTEGRDSGRDQRSREAREATPRERERQREARELFSAWALENLEQEADALDGPERWTSAEAPEQPLEPGETAYLYDEWDRELMDHRVAWCRVIEKSVKTGDRSFVESTRSRYRGLISAIRNQFQLMKPEGLRRVRGELDGEEYDLNAVIDYVTDRRADGQQSERIYTKRLRRERNVAVSFLLDQSSSTARTIGRNPLQPYTHPGRRIIDIEKEGLVLMSEALEAVGDAYAIYGFTSEGRRNVKFYVVKDFDERFTEEIERRIGGITYQHNTRLGAAIRHATARLARREARTRLLIVLSDGRPYDHDYGDARYARDDVREALRQARMAGIIPFCITIDRDSEAELRDLYGEVGYTIIDDVLSLPERLPAIYRRLTT